MKNLLTITLLFLSLNIFANESNSAKETSQQQESFRVVLIEGSYNANNKEPNFSEALKNVKDIQSLETLLNQSETILDINVNSAKNYSSIISNTKETIYKENNVIDVTNEKEITVGMYNISPYKKIILKYTDKDFYKTGTKVEDVVTIKSLDMDIPVTLNKPIILSKNKDFVDNRQFKYLVLIVENID